MIYLTNIDLNGNELRNAVLQPLAAAPPTPKLGQIYFDSTTSTLKWYDGNSWKSADDSSALPFKYYGKQYYKYNDKADESGNHYSLVVVDAEHPFPAGLQPRTRVADDGVTVELVWYEPSPTTVEGLSDQLTTVSESLKTAQESIAQVNQKLQGVEEGAQVNKIEKILVNGAEQPITEKSVSIKVPVKLSELTNDSNFIDSTVSNLVNYYTKSQTYNKSEVNDLLTAIHALNTLVVNELPTENISTTTIYLVPKSGSSDDVHDEYIYIASTSKWERIGNTTLDLSNYLQKDGDASNVTVQFTTSNDRELPTTNDTLSVITGKVIKYLTDLKAVAFTGSYNDLHDTPDHNTAYISGTLSAGSTGATISLPAGSTFVDVSIREPSGELVLTDVSYSNDAVTVSISEALTYSLSILVAYYE